MSQGKPSAFISSTVRDFGDLRGALRYWLEESGFDVRASEYADMEVNPGANTFEACFDAIRGSDFYILLIGERYGSPFDQGGNISVTRQEYRVAYASFIATGRPVPVLFARAETKLVSDNWQHAKRPEPPPFVDAVSIHDFIEEVTRFEEHQQAVQGSSPPPAANWLYSFHTFKDIIDALKVVLALRPDIPRERIYTSMVLDLEELLSTFFVKEQYRPRRDAPAMKAFVDELLALGEDGEQALTEFEALEVDRLHIGHRLYMRSIIQAHQLDISTHEPVVLTGREPVRLAFYLVGGRAHPDTMAARAIRVAATSGALLDYDPESRSLNETPISVATTELVRQLEHYASLYEQADPTATALSVRLPAATNSASPRYDLAFHDALILWGLYHSAENLYRRAASLYRYLQRKRETPLPSALLPTSPLGEVTETQIRRERASREDVRRWGEIPEAWEE